MPRTYKPSRNKNYKKYDTELIEQALNEYNSSSKSLKDIAEKYNITKSVLHRHNTFIMKKQGGQTALAPDVEEYLIQYINICSEWGYPLETIDFRLLIKGYLDRLGLQIKRFQNNMPGPDYVHCFLNRHKTKITVRLSQNIKRSRAAVSPEVIEAYFDELEVSLQGIPLSNIVNYDETNLADDPKRKKVLVKRSVKYPERVMNHSKGSTSVMMAAAADGTLLPSYVVYKAQHVYDTWRQNGPRSCRYNNTSSGWFDSITFEDWVKTVVFSYFQDKSGTKILIGDNLASHLSIELIGECKKRDIRFIFLPANSTHITQPLDVAFFRPLKNAWRDILYNWKKTDGRMQATVPKNMFPSLLKKLLKEIEKNAKNNILAGFEKCGISPMNRKKVLDRLPSTNTDARNENYKEAIDQTVVTMLKEMRYGTGAARISNKKKKINVVPGRSVENVTVNEDLDETEEASDCESNTEEIQVNNMSILQEAGPSKDKENINKHTEIKPDKKTQNLKNQNQKRTNVKKNNLGTESEYQKDLSKRKGKKTDNKSLVKKTKTISEKTSDLSKENHINDIIKDSTKINEPMLTENLEPKIMKPLASPLSMQLVDSTIPKDDCAIDFNQGYFNMDIEKLPVVFEDYFTVNEEVELSSFTEMNDEEDKAKQTEKNTDTTKKRIQIISDEIITKKPKVIVKSLNKIKLSETIVSKKPKFYKNEKEILEDLMNDDVV